MRRVLQLSGLFVLIVLHTTTVFGVEEYEERITVKFSNPDRPGLVKAVFGKGDITVTGYNGKEVIIETKSRVMNVLNPPEDEKAKGLKRISGSVVNVTTVEDENAVVVTRSIKHEVELFIQVPFRTSLKLGGGEFGKNANVNVSDEWPIRNLLDKLVRIPFNSVMTGEGIFEGNITVKDVSGEMEINTLNGNITLQNISGEVVANSLNGNMLVTFKDVNREKPMYFSTIDGDIDVAFPSDIQANLKLKNIDGNIYTDFDINIEKRFEVDKEKQDKGFTGSIPEMVGNKIYGTLNGGGPEIQMTTIDGNIYVRKGKK